MAKRSALRAFRQLTVAVIGLLIAVSVWLSQARVRSWQETLWVTAYPVVGGDAPETARYVADLSTADFTPIESFLAAEAARYGVAIERPFRIDLGPPVGLPPAAPRDGNPLQVALWSLRLRWWAWRTLADQPGPEPDIRLFVIYHDPVAGVALPHSLGLKEGRIAIAHVFASRRMRGSNQVVITHELLHTLGATDKYGPRNLPVYPTGYAEPLRKPLYPQRYAEIMGGRIPLSRDSAVIPRSLAEVRVGALTAAEIRWPGALPQ